MGAVPTEIVHHDDISHGYVVFISIAVLFTVLSTICVILRMFARRLNRSYGLDDWTIIGSLVFAYGVLITTILVATVADAGYHITDYTPQLLERYLKIALANNVLYNASLTLSKMSVLLLYRRIFDVKSFHIMFWVVTFIVISEFLVAECGLIFAYNPIQAQWKFWLPSTHIDDKRFWLATAIINICLDVIILSMPQTRVWKLHQTTKRKVLLSGIFLLGGFVTVASIVRIVELETVNIADLTYTLTTPGIWTAIEMYMSIICACLPTLGNLVRYWRDGTRPDGSRSNGSSPSKLRLWLRSTRSKSEGSSGYSDLEANKTPPESLGTGHGSQEDKLPLAGTHGASNMDMHTLEPVFVRRDVDVYREHARTDSAAEYRAQAARY